MWILLIEDEERLSTSLARGLTEEGYVVDRAADGEAGLAKAIRGGYDALIVDWRLPHRDGRSVVKALREAGRDCPILMLTVMSETRHKVAGLSAGADDFLPKPFAFEELLARLQALLRRPPLAKEARVLQFGPLQMDTERRRVTFDDVLLSLRPKEHVLLQLLLEHPGDVLSRRVIAERVWGETYHVSNNALDVTVSGLREKLRAARRQAEAEEKANPNETLRIETVRGVGYRLTPPPSS